MSRIALVPRDSPFAQPGGFLDADEALRRLNDWAQEHDNLQHFREVWQGATLGGWGEPPSNRRVLADLADRLADGSICLAGPPRAADPAPARRPGAVAPPRPQPPAAPPPPAPSSAAAPLRTRGPAAPETPQLPEAITDYAQQAQCLADAAAAGAPFVEQCAP